MWDAERGRLNQRTGINIAEGSSAVNAFRAMVRSDQMEPDPAGSEKTPDFSASGQDSLG